MSQNGDQLVFELELGLQLFFLALQLEHLIGESQKLSRARHCLNLRLTISIDGLYLERHSIFVDGALPAGPPGFELGNQIGASQNLTRLRVNLNQGWRSHQLKILC